MSETDTFENTTATIRLRDISRRAAWTGIATVAENMFLQNGFEETTVDDIATALDMSPRTFFRYFVSKDQVILSRYDDMHTAMLERLEDRPANEDAWVVLRHICRSTIGQLENSGGRRHGTQLHGIVLATPVLLAGLLQRRDTLQQQITNRLIERKGGKIDPGGRIIMRAMVGTAFACLDAVCGCAQSVQDDLSPADRFDRIMDVLQPRLTGHD